MSSYCRLFFNKQPSLSKMMWFSLFLGLYFWHDILCIHDNLHSVLEQGSLLLLLFCGFLHFFSVRGVFPQGSKDRGCCGADCKAYWGKGHPWYCDINLFIWFYKINYNRAIHIYVYIYNRSIDQFAFMHLELLLCMKSNAQIILTKGVKPTLWRTVFTETDAALYMSKVTAMSKLSTCKTSFYWEAFRKSLCKKHSMYLYHS